MASLFEHQDRHVLPNWRSFTTTLHFGELNDWMLEKTNQRTRSLSIDDYLLSWEQLKTVPIAGDLLSAAFVNGFVENPIVKEAAAFILSNKGTSTNTMLSFAEGIVNPAIDIPHKNIFPENIEDYIESKNLRYLIQEIKKQINRYPLNPILYVELSRLYSIVGLKQKAIQNMSIALHIAPENRFILRAASRLYAHFGLIDYIHNIIRKSDIVKYDPWVTSAEITLATMMNRSSLFVKKGLQMIMSGKYANFSLTELASSIGTLEHLSGNRKKTKQLLKTALISPNDNSLAQVKSILNKDYLFDFDPANYNIDNKYEALALDYYYNGKWNEALENAIYWFRDLPFSKQPAVFAAHIADAILNKPEVAQKLLCAGLISHHNDAQIINNLAYSFALQNKINEAESYLGRLRNLSAISHTNRICLTATRGLIFFRKGLKEEGRTLYFEAIEDTKSISNRHLNLLAILNYAREEILSKSNYVESIMDTVKTIPNDTAYPDVNKLKNDVIDLYKRMKT